MGKLDEAIDALNANIADLEAGNKTLDAVYNTRAAEGKQAQQDTPVRPRPPGPPPPPPINPVP